MKAQTKQMVSKTSFEVRLTQVKMLSLKISTFTAIYFGSQVTPNHIFYNERGIALSLLHPNKQLITPFSRKVLYIKRKCFQGKQIKEKTHLLNKFKNDTGNSINPHEHYNMFNQY